MPALIIIPTPLVVDLLEVMMVISVLALIKGSLEAIAEAEAIIGVEAEVVVAEVLILILIAHIYNYINCP